MKKVSILIMVILSIVVVANAGVYPTEFVGASYGEPSEVEWDFDDGSTNTTTMTPIIDSSAQDGDGYSQITVDGPYAFLLGSGFSAVPGELFTFGGYFRSPTGNADLMVSVQALDSGGGNLGLFQINPYVNSETWEFYSMETLAPAGTATLNLGLYVDGSSGFSILDADHVTLVPEPATLSLLGLGGLLLRRRK